MERLYLTQRGSDSVGLVAGVVPILAAGRVPLGDIENLAILLPGNISYMIFPTVMEVPWLTEPDLRIEDGLRVSGMDGYMGIGGRDALSSKSKLGVSGR